MQEGHHITTSRGAIFASSSIVWLPYLAPDAGDVYRWCWMPQQYVSPPAAT